MNAPRLGLLRLGLLAAAVLLAAAPRAGAQTVFNWDPPAHANVFSTSTNWTPVGPPGTTGEARFNTSASADTVSFNTDPTNARVRVGNDHVTFDLNGHTYTLTTVSTSSPSIMVGGITLADDALLTVKDGTLAGQHAVIAPAIFQTAAGMVVDTGGTLDLAGTFTIGKQLPGSLTVQNGGDVMSATGVLGESGNGNGLVTVTGDGSTWHNSGNVYVGGQAAIDGGNGTLSITNQGLVDVDGTLKLWPGGSVALNGGTLETATLELAGGAFNWTAGTLRFSSDFNVDPSGPLGGSVALSAGKTLEVNGILNINNPSTVNLQGGTLKVRALSGGTNLNWTGGILHLTDSDLVLDSGSAFGAALTVGPGRTLLADADPVNGIHSVGDSGTGMMTVDGGAANFYGGSLRIGQNGGMGTLTITGGGIVVSSGLVGVGPESTGHVTIDGVGSRWVWSTGITGRGIKHIGAVGNGTLEVTNGGVVSAGAMYIGGFGLGGSGEVTFDASMLIVNNPQMAFVGELLVGFNTINGANGSLELHNGSQASSERGVIGPNGHVVLENSTWSSLSFVVEGTLNVTNGGHLETGGLEVFVGEIDGYISSGAVAVDGVGSTWINQYDLHVGYAEFGAERTGSLTLANGATIDARDVFISSIAGVLGDGTILANVLNAGAVSPGASPGALYIAGDYMQTAAGELLIELASASSFDQLLVTGDVALAGTLTVNLLDGFVPSVGQSFTILTADDVDGVFTIEPASPVPGRIFDVIYNPQSVVLTVLPAFTADFDEDGDVDANDLAQWQGDFGVNANSDADNDGDSDGADFLAWQQQLGSPSVVAAGAAAPEPTAAALTAVGLAAMAWRTRRARPG